MAEWSDDPPLDWELPGARPAGPRGAPEALSVPQVVERVRAALARGFPEPVWVVGETVQVRRQAAGHVYLDLIDHEAGDGARATLKLKLWASTARRLFAPRGALRDFRLADSLVVRLRLRPDFWAQGGQLSFIVEDLDPEFTLGTLDRQRKELLARLEAQGLTRRNAARPLAQVPLHVGLVTALDSAAFNDVLRTLRDAGTGFRIDCCDARMQGEDTSRTVRAALATLAARRPDCILLVRGGGGRTDLMWFDREDIARAIADCPVPVLTGIGHEIDTSVADLVAHRAFKTPTAAAEFLVQRAREARQRAEDAFEGLRTAARRALDEAVARLAGDAGELRRLAVERVAGEARRLQLSAQRLRAGTETGLRAADRGLLEARARLRDGRHVQRLAAGAERMALAGPRLQRAALALLQRRADALAAGEARARALDPAHVLRRGYAWLRRADGSALKDAAAARAGEALTAVLRDGELPLRAGAAPGAAP